MSPLALSSHSAPVFTPVFSAMLVMSTMSLVAIRFKKVLWTRLSNNRTCIQNRYPRYKFLQCTVFMLAVFWYTLTVAALTPCTAKKDSQVQHGLQGQHAIGSDLCLYICSLITHFARKASTGCSALAVSTDFLVHISGSMRSSVVSTVCIITGTSAVFCQPRACTVGQRLIKRMMSFLS